MSLAALISELRLELAHELPLRLHPAASNRGQRSSKRAIREEDTSHESGGTTWHPTQGAGYGTRIGLPFSVAFERRLSHPDHWGINEIAARSIIEVGDWCRSRHLSDLHRCPGRSTSLCERIISAIAEFGHPFAQIAWREGIEVAMVEDLAFHAIRHAYAWRHREIHRYMKVARERERDTVVYCPLCLGRKVTMRKAA